MDSERQVMVTVKWAHPAETPALLERLRDLPCGSLTAVMESTGVYGDTLRRQLREAGFEVHQMSAKRVHDACEISTVSLLLSFGSPAELSAQAEEGRERMRRVSRGKLAVERIEAVLESARQTIGLPCVAAERDYLMALGAELRHSREQKERVGLRLSALTQADPQLHALGVTLGRVTTGLLIAEGLDPRAYANSSSYCKAFGLNLKEREQRSAQGADQDHQAGLRAGAARSLSRDPAFDQPQ